MGTRSAKLGVVAKNGRKGLFALETIRKQEILIGFGDEEILPSATRTSIQIDEGKHIIGREETIAYLNHSCDPNAYVDVESMCVRALRDLEKGEEVYFNYLTTEYELHLGFSCNCGSPACHRIVKGFKHLTREQQLELMPYLAPYLRRKLKETAS